MIVHNKLWEWNYTCKNIKRLQKAPTLNYLQHLNQAKTQTCLEWDSDLWNAHLPCKCWLLSQFVATPSFELTESTIAALPLSVCSCLCVTLTTEQNQPHVHLWPFCHIICNHCLNINVCVRCDFWRLAAPSNHCQFSLECSKVLFLSMNYFHAKVWPSNTSCCAIKVTCFIFNRESTFYMLVLVNRWCVFTNSCQILISGIK